MADYSDIAKQFDYDIALSFAGPDRSIAQELADLLENEGVRVFYDLHAQSELWGKDLYQHLQTVYREKAEYCVIILSEAYAGSLWTRHELKQAQARAFMSNREYILPIRRDDTEIPGVNPTVGYIDLRTHSLVQVRDLICSKLFPDGDWPVPGELSWKGELIDLEGEQVASFWPEKIRHAQQWSGYRFVHKLDRVPWGSESLWPVNNRPRCPDCSVARGQYHVPNCDMEECPLCHRQLWFCDCEILD